MMNKYDVLYAGDIITAYLELEENLITTDTRANPDDIVKMHYMLSGARMILQRLGLFDKEDEE